MKAPITVAVTGAAGNIGYALLFRLASGSCFGADQPLKLRLLEIPPGMKALEGVVMELGDSAFPLVHGVEITDDPGTAFKGVNQAFLVGSRPRTKGMDRADLIKANGPIFTVQGKALNDNAASDVRVIVVGNPCNTNALIAMHSAPDIPNERFTAMTRLDENRSRSQLAEKLGVTSGQISNIAVWGNHSNTMFPDFFHAKVNGEPVTSRLDEGWLKGDFLTTVANRGAAIIAARGASSAASAAAAAVDHMRTWHEGTAPGEWASMAIPSTGDYDVPKGIIFSFPVTVKGGKYEVVQGLKHDDYAKAAIQKTANDLLSEKEAVADLLG